MVTMGDYGWSMNCITPKEEIDYGWSMNFDTSQGIVAVEISFSFSEIDDVSGPCLFDFLE